MNRRGFMSFLGIGAVAAPVAVKALADEPEFLTPVDDYVPGPPLFQDGDMVFNGVIVREQAGTMHQLDAWARDFLVNNNVYVKEGDVNASD